MPGSRFDAKVRQAMRSVIWTTAVIAVIAAAMLAVARPAAAEKQFNRCPDDPSVNLPGPEICGFSFPVHVDLPAGTRCSFDVTIDYVLSGTIMFFENPPRAVAHTVGEGTATGNGHTLSRLSHFTETASPEIVFTDHGLFARYRLPCGRTITVFAGYERESIVPPEPGIFHGNPFDAEDAAAFCAALS
jgi:hypothetical protein